MTLIRRRMAMASNTVFLEKTVIINKKAIVMITHRRYFSQNPFIAGLYPFRVSP